jgi:hypothetical protein
MPGLDPHQTREIKESLLSVIDELTEFLLSNRTQLSDDEKNEIDKTVSNLSDAHSRLTAEAIKGTALQIQECVQGIRQATNVANNALKTLSNLKKGIVILTSLVGLGTAILAGNPVGIVQAALGVGTAVANIDSTSPGTTGPGTKG